MLLALLRSTYWIPILGHLIREAIEGPPAAMFMFLGNVVMAILLAVLLLGFPALITVLLIAVATMFVVIIDITRE